MLWDVQEHRSQAAAYARLAEAAASPEKREYFLCMARTSLALARNAEWIESTDEFLRGWRPH